MPSLTNSSANGAEAFDKSWNDLMARLQSKGEALQKPR